MAVSDYHSATYCRTPTLHTEPVTTCTKETITSQVHCTRSRVDTHRKVKLKRPTQEKPFGNVITLSETVLLITWHCPVKSISHRAHNEPSPRLLGSGPKSSVTYAVNK